MDAKAYYGAPDHIYNTIRPILHEPGPIANGTFRTNQGIPIAAGETLERAAYHSNASCTSPRWASGCCSSSATTASPPARRCRPTCTRSPNPRSTTSARRSSMTAWCRSWPSRPVAGSRSTGGVVADRRPLVQAAAADREGRPADHLELRRRRAAQRRPWPTARAGSRRTTSGSSAGATRSRPPCLAPTGSPA